MALNPCKECGNQVSSAALTCPKCGHPVNQTFTTIQQTSKSLKRHILFSVLAFWGGLILAFLIVAHNPQAAQNGTPPPTFCIATIFILGGFIWYWVTKFRIWWNHK